MQRINVMVGDEEFEYLKLQKDGMSATIRRLIIQEIGDFRSNELQSRVEALEVKVAAHERLLKRSGKVINMG